jgi:hypothetical protein
MKQKLWMMSALLGLILSGCKGPELVNGRIVSVKHRTFGITIAQSETTQSPQIRLGFDTTVVQFIPTSTNGPIYAPKYFDTFSIGQNANPFSFSVLENTGSGDVAIGTNATGQAIIPKLERPAIIKMAN